MSPTAEAGPPAPSAAKAAALVGGIVVVVALLTAAAVATSTHDGAGSPGEAAEAYLDALGTGDLVAVLDQLPPDERTAVADGLAALGPELERLGFVAGIAGPDAVDRSLAGVTGPGVGVAVDGYNPATTWFELWIARTDPTSPEVTIGVLPGGLLDPAVADPEVGAWLVADVLGLAGTGLVPGGAAGLGDAPTGGIDGVRDAPPFVAVRHGGGWHVSPAYTGWERWRLSNGIEMPNLAEGPRAIGADTAADLVRDLFTALEIRDAGRIQSMVEPNEAGALYHYVNLVLPTIVSNWDLIEAEPRAGQLTVEEVELEVLVDRPDDPDRRRLVRVTGFAGTYTEDGRTIRIDYADGCLRLGEADRGRTIERCDGTLSDQPLTGTGVDQLFAWVPLGRAFPTFAVAEDRGRWFLSPTRTELFTLAEVLAGLERDDLDTFRRSLRASRALRADDDAWPELDVLLGTDQAPRSRAAAPSGA